MEDKSELQIYYNGCGLDKIRPLNRRNNKEFLIKSKNEGREVTYHRFPSFPYLEK